MFDLVQIITIMGYAGIAAIIFAECGLFFGFFLPGDSLLFTAGFLAAQGKLEIVPLILLLIIAAILGESVGYIFGRHVGPKIFNKKESRFFHPAHVARASEFFAHHGNKAVVLARFMPIVRTFVPIVAGVARMPTSQFTFYNITGGCAWIISMTLLGYLLGNKLENPDRYLYPIVLSIIVISFLPALYEWRKAKTRTKR